MKTILNFLFFFCFLFLIYLLNLKEISWTLEKLAIFTSLFVFVISFIFILDNNIFLPKRVSFFWGLFLIINLVLLPFSSNVSSSIRELILLFAYFLLSLISFNIFLMTKNRLLLLTLFSLLGLLVLISGLYTQYQLGSLFTPSFRLVYPFGWHNQTAGFYLLIFPLSLTSFFLSKTKKEKIIFGLISLIFFLAIIFTYSRGAWFSFIIIPFLFLVLSPLKFNLKKINKPLVFLLLLLFSILLLFMIKSQALSLINISTSWRLQLYSTAIKIFTGNWLVGIGLGNFTNAFSFYQAAPWIYGRFAHNHFLQIASETGIFGLMSFVGIFVAIFYKIFKFFKKELKNSNEQKWIVFGLLGSTLASLIHNLIDTDWNYTSLAVLFWMLIGLLISTVTKFDKDLITLPKLGKSIILTCLLFLIGFSYFLFKINQDFVLANNLFEEKKFEASQKIFRNLVKIYPLSDDYHVWLGSTYEITDEISQAKNEYLQASKLNRFASEPVFSLALLSIRQNNFSEAENYLRQLTESFPYKTPTYYRLLAEVLIKENRKEEAVKVLKECLNNRFPLNTFYRSFQYMYNYTGVNEELWQTTKLLVQILEDEDKQDEAKMFYNRLIETGVSQTKLKLE